MYRTIFFSFKQNFIFSHCWANQIEQGGLSHNSIRRISSLYPTIPKHNFRLFVYWSYFWYKYFSNKICFKIKFFDLFHRSSWKLQILKQATIIELLCSSKKLTNALHSFQRRTFWAHSQEVNIFALIVMTWKRWNFVFRKSFIYSLESLHDMLFRAQKKKRLLRFELLLVLLCTIHS